MALAKWYELRVEGSAGTRAGAGSGMKEGIVVGQGGRLCSLASGGARKFESEQDALDYLGKIKVSGDYHFEAVLCGAAADADSGSALREGQPTRYQATSKTQN